MMCKLAIVILNWNGEDMMRKYLPSVISNSKQAGVDIYVADNNSTDNSIGMLEKDFPEVKIIRLKENYGFAKGYMLALKEVEAEYFMLLNSDVEIRQKNWLTPMLDYMDKHPECGACQPKLMSLRNPDEFEYAGGAGGFIDKYGYPYCRGRVFGSIEKDYGQYDEIVPLVWATGAALLVRAEVFWQTSGLDSTFFAHMEEIDFCWRMRERGYSIVCIPESKAYHLGGATLNQGNPYKTFLNFRNNLLMLYKNLPQKELNSVMRIRFLLDMLAALQFLLKGDIANFKAIFKARKAFKEMKDSCIPSRAEIQKKKVMEKAPEIGNFSLLWQYYVKGNKTFRKIKNDADLTED